MCYFCVEFISFVFFFLDFQIVYDRVTDRSRGFGFVAMGNVEEAKEAIRLFDGSVSELLISFNGFTLDIAFISELSLRVLLQYLFGLILQCQNFKLECQHL